jgi:hypothetical protein
MHKEIKAIGKFIALLEKGRINKKYALLIIDTLKTAIPRKMSRRFKAYIDIKPQNRRYRKFDKDIIYARILCIVEGKK